MAPIIDPEEDYLTIVAAEERIAASEAKRRKEMDEAHANLKGASRTLASLMRSDWCLLALSKVLEAARISSTRPASVPSAKSHATALNELDGSRLSLAKSISDAEGLVASKEAELTALKEEARRLEEYDPAAEHEKELDGTACVPLLLRDQNVSLICVFSLRLQLYKGLGFEPVANKNGKLTKMLVRGSLFCSHSLHLA